MQIFLCHIFAYRAKGSCQNLSLALDVHWIGE
jgi:hypothetical protein